MIFPIGPPLQGPKLPILPDTRDHWVKIIGSKAVQGAVRGPVEEKWEEKRPQILVGGHRDGEYPRSTPYTT